MKIPKFYWGVASIFLGIGLYASDWVFFGNTFGGQTIGLTIPIASFLITFVLAIGDIFSPKDFIDWLVEGFQNPYDMNDYFLKAYRSLPYINKKEKKEYKKELIKTWTTYQKLSLTDQENATILSHLKEVFESLIENKEKIKQLQEEKKEQHRSNSVQDLIRSLEATKEKVNGKLLVSQTRTLADLPPVAQQSVTDIQKKASFLLKQISISPIEEHYLKKLLEEDLSELINCYYALSSEQQKEKIQKMLDTLENLNKTIEQKAQEKIKENEFVNERRFDNKTQVVEKLYL